MITALFVGGPCDGRRQVVEKLERRYVVQQFKSPDIARMAADELPEPVSVSQFEYVASWIYDNYVVYVPQLQTIDQTIQLLAEHYHPPKKEH